MTLRHGILAAAVCSLALGPGLSAAPSPASGQQARVIAHEFLRELFVERDPGAYRRFARPDFIQHDPDMADGVAGREAFFAALAAQHGSHPDPSRLVDVYDLLLVDGDLFALFHHAFSGPGEPGRVFVDIWRVADARIAEHWDVIASIPDIPGNANGMACGGDRLEDALKLHTSPERTSCAPPDPHASREASLAVFRSYAAGIDAGEVRAAIERWLAPDYRQHSPSMQDGKAGAIARLDEQYGKGKGERPRFITPLRIVAEGDYVLTHRQVLYPGARSPSTNVDIFRVRGGLISEHWDVKQMVPDHAANDHGMW